jgi:cold shock CspA family protein
VRDELLFLHQSEIRGYVAPSEGARVEFDIGDIGRGPRTESGLVLGD